LEQGHGSVERGGVERAAFMPACRPVWYRPLREPGASQGKGGRWRLWRPRCPLAARGGHADSLALVARWVFPPRPRFCWVCWD